ncbi:hypothetical protein AB5N19_12952 [Seiridium cardinale]
MNEEQIRKKYRTEDAARFAHCMLHVSLGHGGQTPDGRALFIIDSQNKWIDSASSEPIKKLRIADWRARELFENEDMDRQGYEERAKKCLGEERLLTSAQSSFQREMAKLCGEEARECAERAQLAKDLMQRAVDRGYCCRQLQIEHELRDQKARMEAVAAEEPEQSLEEFDEDLREKYLNALLEEGEDVEKARAADDQLEQNCMMRDERKAELCRLYSVEQEGKVQHKDQRGLSPGTTS